MSTKKIIVFGMARSGTSFVFKWVHSNFDLLPFSEPHLIWKLNKFCVEDDSLYSEDDIHAIRSRFQKIAAGRNFVEKSPPNVVRSDTVLRTFPDAAYIIVDRNRDKIIESCMRRSSNQDQMSLYSLGKYLVPNSKSRLRKGLAPRMSIFRQVPLLLLPRVIPLTLELYLLKLQKKLPFGPRIRGFRDDFPRDSLEYYRNVIDIAEKGKDLVESKAKHKFRFNIDDFDSMEPKLRYFCQSYLNSS